MQAMDRHLRWALAPFLLLGMLIVGPTLASAQSVTVLMPPSAAGQEGAAARLYNALRAQVELHPGYTLNDVPAQTLDEALLMLGCTTLDAECSALVQELLESRFLLYGELRARSNRLESVLTLWDLREARAVHVSVQTIRDDMAFFERNSAVFARAVLYGDEAAISISSTPPGSEVLINNEPRGTTPIVVDGLPLGIHHVEVRSEGYLSATQIVVADLGTNEVEVVLERVPEEREPRDTTRLRRGVGYGMLGAGATGVVVGTLGAVGMRSTQNDFDRAVTTDPARAQELREQGQRQAVLANLGYISGGAFLIGGTVLLLTSRTTEEAASDAHVRWTPEWTPNSVGLQVRGRFR